MSLFSDRVIQVDFKLAIVFNSSGVSFQQLYKVQDSNLGYDAEFITNQDACLFNPCQNGGTCANTPALPATADPPNYNCTCVTGWWGQNCEIRKIYLC